MTAVISSITQIRAFAAEHRRWLLAALVILTLVFPLVSPLYYLSLAIEVLIYAIFALSLDLVLGYTGLGSFGHAAYFGLGAYLTAYLTSRNDLALGLTNNLLIVLPVVVVIVAAAALLIGALAIRTSGIYFLMITLASAQMLFSIAFRWSAVTGGSDGLPGVPRPSVGFGFLSYEFASRESFYYLVLALFFASWWLLRRIVNSPFGWTLRGIRENEGRMRALGVNVFRYKIASFMVGGAFAAVAGMLLTQFFRSATPETLHWSTSGEAIIMLVVGGLGTLTGPIMGAGIVRLFPLLVSSYIDRWEMLEGIMFIAFVLFAPQGVLGLLRGRRNDADGQ